MTPRREPSRRQEYGLLVLLVLIAVGAALVVLWSSEQL
jgi:hypothetical protein